MKKILCLMLVFLLLLCGCTQTAEESALPDEPAEKEEQAFEPDLPETVPPQEETPPKTEEIPKEESTTEERPKEEHPSDLTDYYLMPREFPITKVAGIYTDDYTDYFVAEWYCSPEKFQENRLPITDRTIEKTKNNVCIKASYFDRLKLQEDAMKMHRLGYTFSYTAYRVPKGETDPTLPTLYKGVYHREEYSIIEGVISPQTELREPWQVLSLAAFSEVNAIAVRVHNMDPIAELDIYVPDRGESMFGACTKLKEKVRWLRQVGTVLMIE
ncbi:MAG: hypothetical protein IJP27_04385 [Clostridia bacterium]|nr:hypothetical protein [Clostridia bacterium]